MFLFRDDFSYEGIAYVRKLYQKVYQENANKRYANFTI